MMSGSRNPAVLQSGRVLERDEDLLLFQELHRREKDRIATLLQPISDDFEPNGSAGNLALNGISSGKKGSGYQFFPENNKNDYDWLKTPPATPLFPSLEMEANASHAVVQRELPIIQPLSRFAGHKESANSKTSTRRPVSPNPKPKIPSRSVTPSYRPSISATDVVHKNTKVNVAAASILNQKTSQPTNYDPLKSTRTNVSTSTAMSKPSNQKDNQVDFVASNLSRNLGTSPNNKTKPRSRGVSPLARSTIPVQFPGFSDETPPNLKTDRSTSVTRGRPKPTGPTTAVVHQKAVEPISTLKTRRQSCSPSVTRGRRVQEPKKETKGTQILGSKMVEKVLNARKSISSIDERDSKQKLRGPTNIEAGGFARTKQMSNLRFYLATAVFLANFAIAAILVVVTFRYGSYILVVDRRLNVIQRSSVFLDAAEDKD